VAYVVELGTLGKLNEWINFIEGAIIYKRRNIPASLGDTAHYRLNSDRKYD